MYFPTRHALCARKPQLQHSERHSLGVGTVAEGSLQGLAVHRSAFQHQLANRGAQVSERVSRAPQDTLSAGPESDADCRGCESMLLS